jgi:LmbE family N-acetylglucosaminyl deacetylase
MTDKRCILAIGGHAGDMEIACGGVLIKEAQQGAKVYLLHLSPGGRGHPKKPPTEYGPQKRKEALECGRRIGASVHILDYLDGQVPDSREIKTTVAEIIRQVRPSVVIAHWRTSMHPDHVAAHRVADIAVLWAALEGIGKGAVWRGVRRFLFTENWEDPESFAPYLYVDATAQRDAWRQAVQAYELFRGGVVAFDYVGYYDALGKVRGTQVGAGWAQAFGVWHWAQRQKAASLCEV